MNKTLIIGVGLAILIGIILLLHTQKVTSFAECEAQGGVIMESYPRQCRARSGQVFINEAEQNKIQNEVSTMHAEVPEVLVSETHKLITGKGFTFEAPRTWYVSNILLTEGCPMYSVSNPTSDGHRTAGEVVVIKKECYNADDIYSTELTEKSGYIFHAIYDEATGTTPTEIQETKGVFIHVLKTFKLN